MFRHNIYLHEYPFSGKPWIHVMNIQAGSVNLILAILKVISWVRMLYEFMCSFFNKIHLILQALSYCQKYDVLQPLLSCNIKHAY